MEVLLIIIGFGLSIVNVLIHNYFCQARLQVPQVVLEQIRSYNNLDMELYKYAQAIFAKQSEHMKQKFVTAVSA